MTRKNTRKPLRELAQAPSSTARGRQAKTTNGLDNRPGKGPVIDQQQSSGENESGQRSNPENEYHPMPRAYHDAGALLPDENRVKVIIQPKVDN